MAEGWISIHRKIQDCWIWTDEEFSKGQAWVDLLLLVNHKDTKIPFNGEFITVKAGQRITSIASLAERWKWSRHKVSDFLNILEKDEMITQIRDNKKTLITIVNFEVYQNGDVIEGHQKDIKRTSKGHQKDTNNNDNNENNENKSNEYAQIDEWFEQLYSHYPKKKKGKSQALQTFRLLLTTGRTAYGKKYKFTYDQICEGLNNYCNQTYENNGGEIGDLRFWKDFSTLMNQIQDYIEE